MTFEKKFQSTLNKAQINLTREYEFLSKFSNDNESELNYYIGESDDADGINVKQEMQEIENELFSLIEKIENLKNSI